MNCLHCNNKFSQMSASHKFCRKECNSAYRRENLGTCIIEGCGEKAVTISEKLCHFHRRRKEAGLSMTNERAIRPRGTGTPDKKGYIVVRVAGQNKFEHRLIAEKALGKPLPSSAQVHHWNEKRWDNRPTNLVVCPSEEYHRLLHKRAKDLGIVFE